MEGGKRCLEEGSSIFFSGKTAFHRITILTIFGLICLLLGSTPSTPFTIVSFRMWHSRSVVDIVNISNKRLFTREILNTEIGSGLKSGSATPRVAARPQLKHSVGAQHSTLSRAPTCCFFIFYSKYLLFDRTPNAWRWNIAVML